VKATGTTDVAVVPAAASGSRALTLLVVVAGVTTTVIRLAATSRSFDLFGDEVIYTDLGHSAAAGGFPGISGHPFFLHPPGFFYLEAGWEKLLGYQGDLITHVYQMRALNAVLAGATAVALVLLVARAGSVWAAAVAGALFAVEPYCIRQNDRVLLETAMMLWVLTGYLALAYLIGRPRDRWVPAAAVGTGALFGLAVLTKDVAALLTVLPLLAAAALGWGLRRRVTLLVAGVTAATYGVYLAVVAATGHFGPLWQAKTEGIQRLLGLIQTTGFNKFGSTSLIGRLTSEVSYFGVTYALLALAITALVLLLRRGGPLQRMLGLLQIAAFLTLGYALFVGTLEEQALYLLLVPSLLTVPVAATLWRGHLGRHRQLPRTALLSAVAILMIGINFATCVQWLTQPDNGYARLRQYLAAHVPAGSAIVAADGTSERGISEWALSDRYRIGRWATPAARARARARYVVVPWATIKLGYGHLSMAQAEALVRQGRPVFIFHERTYGDLVLYQLPLPRGPGHGR
jgi:4-amino-4-deoxy-L-arabinose transferase-like glycosyltransferase